MKIELKLGYLCREMVYDDGSGVWLFYAEKPTRVEEYDYASGTFRPAVVKQIWYTEGEAS